MTRFCGSGLAPRGVPHCKAACQALPSMGCTGEVTSKALLAQRTSTFWGNHFQISCHTEQVSYSKLLRLGSRAEFLESLSPGRFGSKLLCKTPCKCFRREPSSVQALSTAPREQRAPGDLRSIPSFSQKHNSPSSPFLHVIFKSLRHTE